jgi:hypothetical protein
MEGFSFDRRKMLLGFAAAPRSVKRIMDRIVGYVLQQYTW